MKVETANGKTAKVKTKVEKKMLGPGQTMVGTNPFKGSASCKLEAKKEK